MKILIADIPDDGLELDSEEKFPVERFTLLSPVRARLSVRKAGREIIVDGSLEALAGFQCSRCLKEFTEKISVPVRVVYHPVEEMDAERHELKDDEMDMGFYRAEEIDMQELLSEQMLLNIDMKPLCQEHCKGLCPECGADLNSEECRCTGKAVDPRLEGLRKFFEKGKE